jgi:hypothetical protein
MKFNQLKSLYTTTNYFVTCFQYRKSLGYKQPWYIIKVAAILAWFMVVISNETQLNTEDLDDTNYADHWTDGFYKYIVSLSLIEEVEVVEEVRAIPVYVNKNNTFWTAIKSEPIKKQVQEFWELPIYARDERDARDRVENYLYNQDDHLSTILSVTRKEQLF